MPRVAIGVTGRERCDPHFSWSGKCPAVTDGSPFRDVANQRNARFPCHHRLEQLLKFRDRRNAVEHDASTDQIECLRMEREYDCALQNVCLVTGRKLRANLLDYPSVSYELIERVLSLLFCFYL